MLNRRTAILASVFGFPAAVATATEGEAARALAGETPAESIEGRMFFVVDFNWGAEEFEYVGAFTKKDEAEAFAATIKPMGNFKPIVALSTWRDVLSIHVKESIERLASDRLVDRLAEELEARAARRAAMQLPAG